MTDHDQYDDELARRLRASVDHRIPEEARQRHLAAVEQALSETAPTSTVGSGAFTQLRRGLTAAAASLSLLVPTGVAVASQGAMPGQPLYDVKQATEVAWQVVDGTVRARHRLDELERLLDAGAPRAELQVAVQRALDAVQALPADHPLQLRLLRLLNRYDRLVAATADDQRDDDVLAPTSGSSGDDSDDREDRSGSGSGDDDADDDADDDSSGSGSGSDDTETESESDDDSSGSGSDDDPTEADTDDDSSGSGSDDDAEEDTDDDSSGSGSDDGPEEDSDDDSSGSGSGSD